MPAPRSTKMRAIAGVRVGLDGINDPCKAIQRDLQCVEGAAHHLCVVDVKRGSETLGQGSDRHAADDQVTAANRVMFCDEALRERSRAERQ